jgi:hypothetical protein
VGAFAARVLRLDPAAVVRLRGGALWASLPFGVLVSRAVPGLADLDRTVRGDELLTALQTSGDLPAARDDAWRWSLPAVPGTTVERIPAAEVVRLSEAAASTVRTASVEGVGGRAVGSRALRDALLDHVPIIVTTDQGAQVAVSQRLIQAVRRMAFIPSAAAADAAVDVRVSGPWVGLAAPYGSAWHRSSLLIR